ncbi:Response regulator receiver domain-containing protein [Filimonas lacunae]|uniref:Response regulator receiver domain-containing protein n=1 Tax=Filimonas lacunae TaxID=477680 RepID=A0A173MET4_9BACT|nr:response regulator [Filimonas lacunae]BAV06085.1 sensor histidine kinase [Filimonas lacunae]SIT24583.1 Response regulator receiver domain-containing protein [Filimonas lacunae]
MDKGKVLIVDDDARNIFALSAVLKSRGYTCIAAGDVKEAMQKITTQEGIKVVLLDMMLPDMDGYEALPDMKAAPEYQGIPIIAVTAQAMAGDRERCMRAGADGYVSKPVNVDELIRLMNALTD